MEKFSKLMEGKTVLIAGGSSCQGAGIVRFFLKQSATVIAPVKSLTEINKLKAFTHTIKQGSLITQLTDMPDYDEAFDIAEAITEKYGKIDIGISIFNSIPCNKGLTNIHINDWQKMLDYELTPFFLCARIILQSMKVCRDGLYVSACDSNFFEQATATPLSKVASCLKMEMSKTFAEETKNYNVRYHHLWIDSPFKNNVLPADDSCTPDPEIIGSQIMNIFFKNDIPDNVFQLIPGVNTIE
jgi:NADP-dependent 3-hydroxy acid dehydrogenase YdfG